jgi:pimeloyl-ACP methyl ester carboxylesterase
MIARLLRLVFAVQLATALLLGYWLGDLVGFVIVFLIHPTIIAVDFAITRWAGCRVPPASRLALWKMIHTYGAEVTASLRSFSWAHPYFAHARSPVPEIPRQPQAILFIHGYFCNRAIWLPLMRFAARRGFLCEAVTLEPPFAVIENYLETIERAAAALLSQSESERLVIVGHSMGGIAARAWMRAFGSDRVARLVTLGSPHAGTVMAALGHGGNVGQMRRDSAWLSRLMEDELTATRSITTCVYSYHDNIVAPQTSASLEGAHNIALAGIGHVSLVYDRRVWEIVLAAAQSNPKPSPISLAGSFLEDRPIGS